MVRQPMKNWDQFPIHVWHDKDTLLLQVARLSFRMAPVGLFLRQLHVLYRQVVAALEAIAWRPPCQLGDQWKLVKIGI